MWLFDAESQKLIEANEAAAKLYGYSSDEMRSMPMTELQAPEDLARFLAQLNRATNGAPEIWRHRTKSGRAIDVEIAVHEIDYGGRPVQLAVIMDVTGRRDLEEQLTAGAEDGSRGHAGRRRGARLQQSADHHHRLQPADAEQPAAGRSEPPFGASRS